MTQFFLLGDRAYRSVAQQPTFAQAGYLMGALRVHGLDAVINAGGDLLGAILDAGCTSRLIAGLLVEDDGRKWTRDGALKNAEYFDGLTADSDHAQLMTALETLLVFFCQSGTGSSTHSPTSSATGSANAPPKPRRRPAKKYGNSTTSGPTSSPSSPSSTASA